MKLLQFIEKFREPKPESVVTKLDGKVDCDHGEGDVDDVSGEQLARLVQTLLCCLAPAQLGCREDVRTDPVTEEPRHGEVRQVASCVGAEHQSQHGQALSLPALAQQELGRLWQQEQRQGDQQAGHCGHRHEDPVKINLEVTATNENR